MILDSPTKILQLIASATCDVTVSGYVNDTGRPSFSEETKATASTQTICLAPGRLPKVIEHTSIKTTGGANTLTVQIYDSAGSTKTSQQIRAVLAADERLGYDAGGWYVTDANGTTKVGTSGWVIAAGKIGTLSNSLTFAGTDGSTLNIGTGGTLGTAAYTAATAYEAAGAIATHAALQTGVHGISITAAKTLTVTESLTLSGTDGTTMTFPSTSGTVATLNTTNVFTVPQTLAAGTVSAPSLTWGDATTGLYRIGANNVGFAVSGAKVLDISANNLTIVASGASTPQLIVKDGGTFGTNATPRLLMTDTAGTTGGYVGFLSDASGVLSVYNNNAAGTNAGEIWIRPSGSAGIGKYSSTGLAITGTLSSTGVLSTTDATDASSATVASLKTAGGIAAVKALWIGTTSRLVGAVTMDSTLGVTGVISGTVNLNLTEMSAPTGIANKAVIYAEDNGAGKTKLMCKLGDDVAIQIAIQA